MKKLLLIAPICFSLTFVTVCNESTLYDISAVSMNIISYTQNLIQQNKNDKNTTPFIAIAGCSAVGKSEFTKALCQELLSQGINAKILKQDDFMNPITIIENYFIHPHLDYKKMHDFIKQIKNGELQLSKPKFDWKERTVIYQDFDLKNVDVILFEGTYVLCDTEPYNFAHYSNLRLFIYAQADDIVNWNWQRENSGKCSHVPRNREKFDQDIAWDMEDYYKNILPTKALADLIIEKDSKHNYLLHTNSK